MPYNVVLARAIMSIMQHFFLQTCYNARVVLNVAITQMVAPEANVTITDVCPNLPTPVHAISDETSYPWPRQVKAMVLYSFYVGYTISQLPGGWLADKYGARWVEGTCLILTALITAAFPISIHYFGYQAAILLRFILGLAHGPCIPCVSSLVSTWIPEHERTIYGGIAFSGTNLGVIMGSVLTGVIIEAFDWRMAFYIWASYCGAFFLFFICYVFSFPDTHPNIHPREVSFIKKRTDAQSENVRRRPLTTPWLKMLTNGPYLANICANFAHNYIYFSFVTYVPTYLTEILKFDVNSSGTYTALPYVVLWISALTFSFTGAYLFKCLKVNTFNMIFGAGGNVASSAIILTAKYIGCNRPLAVGLFCLSMVPKAFYYMTIMTNISALSRNYGGILCGMSNSISSLSGIVGNQVIGALTKQGSIQEWVTVYWICTGLAIFTTIIFCLFASNKRQDFDIMETEMEDEDD